MTLGPLGFSEDDCPDVAEHHQPGIPEAYVKRQEWFTKMRKTHTQKRCQGCGLWVVWVKR